MGWQGRRGEPWRRGEAAKWVGKDGGANLGDEVGQLGGAARWSSEAGLQGGAARWSGEVERRGGGGSKSIWEFTPLDILGYLGISHDITGYLGIFLEVLDIFLKHILNLPENNIPLKYPKINIPRYA